jgi:hypothetical protein
MVEADLRGWLPVMGVMLSEEQIKQVLEEAEEAVSPHVSDAATFEVSAHVVTGTRA